MVCKRFYKTDLEENQEHKSLLSARSVLTEELFQINRNYLLAGAKFSASDAESVPGGWRSVELALNASLTFLSKLDFKCCHQEIWYKDVYAALRGLYNSRSQPVRKAIFTILKTFENPSTGA